MSSQQPSADPRMPTQPAPSGYIPPHATSHQYRGPSSAEQGPPSSTHPYPPMAYGYSAASNTYPQYGYYNPYSTMQPYTPYPPPEAAREPLVQSSTGTTQWIISTPSNPPPTTAAATRSRKRAGEPAGAPAKRTRRNENVPPVPSTSSAPTRVAPSAFGPSHVGAQDPAVDDAPAPPALLRFASGGDHHVDTGKTLEANDVWYFIEGVNVNSLEANPNAETEADQLRKQDPKQSSRPRSAPFLVCRPCHREGQWKAWKNGQGQTANIRAHLSECHHQMYCHRVIVHGLKRHEEILQDPKKTDRGEREPFSLAGFYQRLVRFFAVAEQSINLVEAPEFRDLMLYLCIELKDEDIPHRTELGKLIMKRFQEEYSRLVADIENAAGCVSFTSDIWSRANMEPYMAVTAHYIVRADDGKLKLRHRLVAFRVVHGTHDGKHLAEVFLRVLKEIRALERIGGITLDNASNNDTMMEHLEQMLKDLKIYFDRDGNRIRCFPHIINIAVKTGIKYVSKENTTKETNPAAEATSAELRESAPQTPRITGVDFRYAQYLGDIIGSACSLSTFVRWSDQRRNDLFFAIRKGNELLKAYLARQEGSAAGVQDDAQGTSWEEEDPFPFTEALRVVVLLRDVDTRWSATYLMIRRLLYLYPAVVLMFRAHKYRADQDKLLNNFQIRVLTEVAVYMRLFHQVQELFSAVHTPTLSHIIPTYELLLKGLTKLKRRLPGIAHVIEASEGKLIEYLGKSRRSRIYALAMGINPRLKFEWAKNNWPADDVEELKKHFRDAMLEHARAMHRESAKGQHSTQTGVSGIAVNVSPAAMAHTRGNDGLEAFIDLMDDDSIFGVQSASPDVTNTCGSVETEAPNTGEPAHGNAKDVEAMIEAQVDREFNRWQEANIIRDPARLRNLDLLRSWEHDQYDYPIIFRVALDTLPVQASAVPCERVFSSSKETDTLRRANLGPEMMEVLQMLKYMFREERLSFTDDLLAREIDLARFDIDPTVYDDLLTSGRADELAELLRVSEQAAEASLTTPDMLPDLNLPQA